MVLDASETSRMTETEAFINFLNCLEISNNYIYI